MKTKGKTGPAAARIAVLALVVSGVLALASCAGLAGASEEAAYADYSYVETDESPMTGSAAPQPMASAERSAVAVPGEGPAPALVSNTDATAPPTDKESGETESTQRLRVYSADLELVVASVEESRDSVIHIVETAGGYVESSGSDYLVVRVPAAQFDPLLAEIEAVGSVRSRAVRTSDVTDQFFDLERRLRISQASRDRLLELLEQTEDSEERVTILRDIRRLTEEIEQLRASLQSLEQLIRFSRITIQLISRIQLSRVQQQQIPFWWIASLAPLGSPVGSADADIAIIPDDSFAVFESGRALFAEAADGTQFRAGAVRNEPRGDNEFWQRALSHHLEPFYRSVGPMQAGGYRGVLLESKDSTPFFYLILVQARDDELLIVEVFFPNPQARNARLDAVIAAVEGGEE